MIRKLRNIHGISPILLVMCSHMACIPQFAHRQDTQISGHSLDCLDLAIAVPAAKSPADLLTISRSLRDGIKTLLSAKIPQEKQGKLRDLLKQQIIKIGGIPRSQLRALMVDIVSDQGGPCQKQKCVQGIGIDEGQIDRFLDQYRIDTIRDSRSANAASRRALEVLLGSLKDDLASPAFNSLAEFPVPATRETSAKLGITQWQTSQIPKSQTISVAALKGKEIYVRFVAEFDQNMRPTLSQYKSLHTDANRSAIEGAFKRDIFALNEQSESLSLIEHANAKEPRQNTLIDDPEFFWLEDPKQRPLGEAAFAAAQRSAKSKALIAQAAYVRDPSNVGNLVVPGVGAARYTFTLARSQSTDFMKVWTGEIGEMSVVILGLSGTRADFTTIKANVASTFFTPYTNPLTASQDSLWAHLLSWSPPAVQLGIANLWRSHAPLVQKSIETALDGSSNKQIYVLICGHSLGGAVAQLAGVDLARYLAAKGISHVVQVAAFNPPKVGNRSFVQLAEETLSHFNSEKGLRSSFAHHRPMLKLVKFHRQGDVIRLFPLLSTEIHDFAGIPVDEPRYAVNLTAPAPSGSLMDKHSLTRWLTHDLVGQSVIYRSGDDNFLAKAFKYSVKAAYAPHLLSEPEIQVGHELYFQSYRFW